VRVLIADDDRFMRTALAAALRTEFEVVGVAADADEAIELARLHRPDAAILDLDMPGGGGLRATREIRAGSPGTSVVVLSGEDPGRVEQDVLAAGASAYLPKGTARADLARTLRDVAAGGDGGR